MRIADKQISQDGSVKYLLECDDQESTEAIYFINQNRPHCCISSMIGCPEACRFCASGLYGMKRRMSADEIVTQVEFIIHDIQAHHSHLADVTHLSYQGMGEPLLNYHNVLHSIVTLKERFPGITAYSLSTVGEIRMLKKLLTEETHYIDQLYLSLHAADQKKRVEIIPMGKTNPIDKLVKIGADFARRVGRPTIASYLLLEGFNDSDKDAENLLQLVNHEHYRIQILLFNPIFGLPFVRVREEKADAFCEKLKCGGLDAYVTLSRGRDIDGGCGQLRTKKLSRTLGARGAKKNLVRQISAYRQVPGRTYRP